jgi:hypothetical protein
MALHIRLRLRWANKAKPGINYQPPPPLGVSADDVLLTMEHVPRIWELSQYLKVESARSDRLEGLRAT